MKTFSPSKISSDELVAGLCDVDAYPDIIDSPVVVHETHISWVFLAGDYAYKVKKPVRTSFLDYSTLSSRERCCQEEIRLDRRYASDLYLDVVPITFQEGKLCVDGRGEVAEFAVKMLRFPDDALLSDRLQHGKLTAEEVFQLAGTVASFHRRAARSNLHQPFGSPESVLRDALDNGHDLESSVLADKLAGSLRVLKQWIGEYFDEHQLLFSQRLANGFIRECHGDLHLDNVIRWRGELIPFDGIEFNDTFRWIDVMSDAAFLAMDFAARDHLDLCRSFCNAYLEQTGDHASLPLLRWYLVYRAMVRAKVASIRAQQKLEQGEPICETALEDCRRHLDLAYRFTLRERPCLWITHGVSGSGKTTGSELIVQRRGAIRLRSDLERKRHYGLSPGMRPDGKLKEKLYSESANQATYCRLRRMAHCILRSGYSVVIDATFLKRHQRQLFRDLALSQGAGFAILNFHTDEQTLRQRVADRMARGDDASDADQQVLESQIAAREELTDDEKRDTVEIPDTVAAINAL